MSKRIVTSPPRLVGKPLDGVEGTPRAERAEAVKHELQRFNRQLEEALNQLSEDFWSTQPFDGSLASSEQSIHSFFLGGM